MTGNGRITTQIETALRPHLDGNELLGLAWLVAVGDTVRAGALGHLDAERTRPAMTDSIFRISSMTKPVTRVARHGSGRAGGTVADS